MSYSKEELIKYRLERAKDSLIHYKKLYLSRQLLST